MSGQERSLKTHIILAAVILVLLTLFKLYDVYQGQSQAALLKTVKSIAHRLKDVYIICEAHGRRTKIKLNPSQIKEFEGYLANASIDLLEGHNPPSHEFTIILTTKDNKNLKLLAEIREKDQNDIYLSRNLYHKARNGSLWRLLAPPIKIGGAGKLTLHYVTACTDK